VIIELVRKEGGFPKADIEAVYLDVLDGFDYYIEEYKKVSPIDFPINPEIQPNTQTKVEFVPHGVIGHIGIWNYPFWQTMITVIPALLTGNSIVYKPSEYATMTGLKISGMVHEAGVPENVFITLIGGAEIGKEIVKSDVDAIVFTGGIDTGLDIVKNAGIKPLILELSGNDATIVCSDADIEQTIRGIAWGTFTHGGQNCIRIKRIYVAKSISEKFIPMFVEFCKRIDAKEDVGPLIREHARNNVDRVVKDAVKKGAKILLGGKKIKGEGFFYEPTILLIDRDDLEVTKKETFGPVCPIRIVKNEGEAVKLANDTKYGLGATIWTQDYRKGMELAKRLEVGTVWINDSNMPLICGEFLQGWKQSGIPSSQKRLWMFLKKRTVVRHKSKEPREWWFS